MNGVTGKLLLVEDQAYFRKGLRKMIEEHSLGWTVAGEAENGQEALELVERLEPNLVLTDIRMPGMDGLELAERLKRREPGPDVVILTGYDDFKYAQAAIRHGVVDFLLKPCNEEALMEVLEKARERLLAACRRQEEQEADRKLKLEASVRALLLRLPLPPGGAAEGLPDRMQSRYLVLVGVDDYFPAHKQYEPQDLGLLQFAVFNIVHELLGDAGGTETAVVPLEFDRFCLVAGGERQAEEAARSIREAVERCLGISFSVFVSPKVMSMDDPPQYYERFARSVKHRTNKDGAAPGGSLQGGSGQQGRVKELQTKLTACIMLGQPEKLERLAVELAEDVARLPLEDAKMEALAMAFAMSAAARLQFEEEGDPSVLGSHIERLQVLKSTEQVAAWARETGGRFLETYAGWRGRKNENIIARTLDYLDKNYMNDCSLAELAAMLHISPAYFSKLFKKETGDNFSAYLTKLRMRKAALLLLHTEMRVFEIAAAVGYDDPNYFTNVFRMLHGMSPSDYRKQHRSMD